MARARPKAEEMDEAVQLVAVTRVRAGGGLVLPGALFAAPAAVAVELVVAEAAREPRPDELPAEAAGEGGA